MDWQGREKNLVGAFRWKRKGALLSPEGNGRIMERERHHWLSRFQVRQTKSLGRQKTSWGIRRALKKLPDSRMKGTSGEMKHPVEKARRVTQFKNLWPARGVTKKREEGLVQKRGGQKRTKSFVV